MFNVSAGFDVYNIETAMPKIDLEAIESHLRAAREEERRVSWFDPLSMFCMSRVTKKASKQSKKCAWWILRAVIMV